MITLKIGWCNILGFWHCAKWELTTVLGMKKIFCKGLISHVFVSNHNFQHCETAREGILISCRNSHYSLLSIDFCFSLFFIYLFIKKAFFNNASTPLPALKASSSVSQVLWGLMYLSPEGLCIGYGDSVLIHHCNLQELLLLLMLLLHKRIYKLLGLHHHFPTRRMTHQIFARFTLNKEFQELTVKCLDS